MTRRRCPEWLRGGRHGAAHQATMRALCRAMSSNDLHAIRRLLHRSVTLIIDSGGRARTALIPLSGQTAASSELMALMTAGTTAAMASINGVPGVTLMRDGEVVGAVTAELRSGVLSGVWVVSNPDKLRHWNR